jgi:uncharacterized protein involved in type VI secretion and phage assembly
MNPPIWNRVNTPVYGVVCGVVVDNADPDGLHRVKVRLPWLPHSERSGRTGREGDFVTCWARVAMTMAGPGSGVSVLPANDDQVLLAFEFGDPSRPVVIGSLWSGVDKPVHKADDASRFITIRSRSGGVVQIEDMDSGCRIVMQTDVGEDQTAAASGERKGHRVELSSVKGAEGVTIADADSGNSIFIDMSGNAIKIASKTGDISISAPAGSVSVDCVDFKVKATGSADIGASRSARIQAEGPATLKSSAVVTVRGSVVRIN